MLAILCYMEINNISNELNIVDGVELNRIEYRQVGKVRRSAKDGDLVF